MPGAVWFRGARFNFAENLLRYDDDKIAIISRSECRQLEYVTYCELKRRVTALAGWMHNQGIRPGDRVGGYVPNIPESIIAMLATTWLGAIWSSCSPDFGVAGALGRFSQITPRILFACDGYRYGGKPVNTCERVREIQRSVSSIERVVLIPNLDDEVTEGATGDAWVRFSDAVGSDAPPAFQGVFGHPVYIMYSSGTTGKPKCIVHGAGGTLLQHYKELALHTDLKREDVIFYFTTCGWMMWNWLVSSLAVGATVFLYEGSPTYPKPDILWDSIDTDGITVFGTSPKYLSACQKAGLAPRVSHSLGSLRTILSTGSPLSAENFAWVYREVKADLQLASISGGTDILSCFMLGCPLEPVYSEEIQKRGLGMQVEVYDNSGAPALNQVGELVCAAPFPSMPVGFWNDPDRSQYHAAYFEKYPGVWRHGDYVKLTPRGGVIVYGRSDATLNPGGVRIGSAEIYGPVESLSEVVDCLAVGQKWRGDVRVVLFVVLRDGLTLTDELREKICATIRLAASPRHVPSVIVQIGEVPRTLSGKKVELAVTQTIHGESVANADALANPASLEQFVSMPALSVL